jgi:lipoprotein NlpD
MTAPRVLAALVLVALLSGCASSPAPVADRGDRAAASGSRYTVQKGDTLYSIAWRAGLNWKTLASLNGIGPPYRIQQGQVLQLRATPSRVRTASASAPATARSAPKPTPSRSKARSPKPSPMPTPPPLKGPLRWAWPVSGTLERPFAGSGAALNKGLDIQGTPGSVVRAAAPGVVVYAGAGLRGFAALIIVKHDDTWLSAYAHNAESLVKEGAPVAAGASLARLGRGAQGQRLHFELRRDGKPIDPQTVLPKGGP